MIVIAIVGILCAIAIPNFIEYRERVRQEAMTPNDITVQEEVVQDQQKDQEKPQDEKAEIEEPKGDSQKL
jgi:type II secretory pathway pseudopilin PulG